MRISIIAAVARNRAIGKDNKLVYRLPDDMKRFKALTTGHTVVMGRKTFESLPKGALPNRRNIVLSRTRHDFPECEAYTSLEEALKHCSHADAFFPEYDGWHETWREEHARDGCHAYDFAFIDYAKD